MSEESQLDGKRRSPRWSLRRMLRRFRRCGPAACSLVYAPGYEQGIPGVPLDPARGEKVLRFLFDQRLLDEDALLLARPASLAALLRAHDPAYLESLDERALTRVLGLELGERDAARVIELERLMTGGTLLATRAALRSQGIAVNLGGGFHHAHRDRGQGFCVFNDVAVAILDARARGLGGNVLVVDLDLHDGNGTRAIFAGDPSVHTYSVHNENWGPCEALSTTCLALGAGVGDERYLATISGTLPSVIERVRPVLAFFVAGSDPVLGDTLGNWLVSPAGLLARDRLVFELLRGGTWRVPVVMVLSGGYGHEAWRLSARTLGFLLSGRVIEPPGSDEIVLSRYHRIGQALRAADLGDAPSERPFELLPEDLVGAGLDPNPSSQRFLDVLSLHGVELLLERFGLLARLREKGFDDLELSLDTSPAGQTLRIVQQGRPSLLLVELRVSRSGAAIPGHELAVIEWLLLQNPKESFGPRREALPGQRHPGLGLLRDVLGSLSAVCERLGLDGLAFTPSHYHAAVRSRALLRAVVPRDEARLRAMAQALEGLSLPQACQALAQGRLIDHKTGRSVGWEPCLIALPVSPRLRERLHGPAFEAAVSAARQEFDFELSPAAEVANPGPPPARPPDGTAAPPAGRPRSRASRPRRG